MLPLKVFGVYQQRNISINWWILVQWKYKIIHEYYKRQILQNLGGWYLHPWKIFLNYKNCVHRKKSRVVSV